MRHDRIGDLLISRPLLSALRGKVNSGTQIDILLSYKNAGAFFFVKDLINEKFVLKKGLIKNLILISKIRKQKFDLIIDLFDNQSSRSNVILRLINTKYRLGIDKENRSLYSHVVPLADKSKFHIIDRISKLLLPFGFQAEKLKYLLSEGLSGEMKSRGEKLLKYSESGFRVGLVISGSDQDKYFGTVNLIAFIGKIAISLKNCKVIIFGTENLFDEIREISENSACLAAPIVSSVEDYASMLSVCDMIVTPDTSAVHFASAFAIPCLAVYKTDGSGALLPWYPYDIPCEVISIKSNRLDSVSPDELFGSFSKLYGRIGEGQN